MIKNFIIKVFIPFLKSREDLYIWIIYIKIYCFHVINLERTLQTYNYILIAGKYMYIHNNLI